MLHLTRRQDAIVDRFRRAARRAPSEPCVLLDGDHLLRDALAAGVLIDVVIATRERWQQCPDLAEDLRASEHPVALYEAAATVLDAASPVKTPTGIVALARWQPAAIEETFAGGVPLAVAAVDVQDPGNFGAIVRSADALGASGVIATGASADPAGWKALRGTMGSAFRLPVARDTLESTLSAARSAGARIFAATADGTPADRCDLRGSCLFLLGSEGQGLPDSALEESNERIAVPMRRGINSLNVAVTAALLLYEARRQRS